MPSYSTPCKSTQNESSHQDSIYIYIYIYISAIQMEFSQCSLGGSESMLPRILQYGRQAHGEEYFISDHRCAEADSCRGLAGVYQLRGGAPGCCTDWRPMRKRGGKKTVHRGVQPQEFSYTGILYSRFNGRADAERHGRHAGGAAARRELLLPRRTTGDRSRWQGRLNQTGSRSSICVFWADRSTNGLHIYVDATYHEACGHFTNFIKFEH